MIGSTLAFFIGRYLGREFADSLISDKLKSYDEAIEQDGVATMIYLRLLHFSCYTHETSAWDSLE